MLKFLLRKNAMKGFPNSFSQRTKKISTLSNVNTTLSRNEKLFYIGIGSAAVFGILNVMSQGISLNKSHPVPFDTFSAETKTRLFSAYSHVVSGIGLTSLFAGSFFRAGVAHRMATMSPLAIFGGGILLTLSSCIATQLVDYQAHPILKYTMWTLFNASIAVSLCPLVAMGSPVLLKGAIATAGIVGSMSAIAAVSPSDSFLRWGTGLGIGLGAILAASIGQIFFPSPLLNAITLYGGLGLFSLFTLYDTQMILHSCQSRGTFDPVNTSIGLYLNIINIFVRMVAIFGNKQRKN